jgi:DNA-binding LytR/AlgR family response regulator
MNLTCYIVDDEPLAIEVLESHLKKVNRIEIAGTFQDAVKAFEALQTEPVDLLFLDIQMPGLTGIKLLQTLKNPPGVIFTTAYREYALEGFELDVIDYLLKPIPFERFLKAIDKVFERVYFPGNQKTEAARPKTSDSVLHIQAGKKHVKLHPADILFIESQRDYINIKTTKKEILVHQTITSMEEKLPADKFLRIHRSFIVNIDRIESWSAVEVELPGLQLPVGRTYKQSVMKVLKSRSTIL